MWCRLYGGAWQSGVGRAQVKTRCLGVLAISPYHDAIQPMIMYSI
jgi:hypothetical protein